MTLTHGVIFITNLPVRAFVWHSRANKYEMPAVIPIRRFILFVRMVSEEKLLEIEIEPGMKDGQEYPFTAEGLRPDHLNVFVLFTIAERFCH